MRPDIFVILAALSAATISAQSVPSDIFTDPHADAAHPAQMTVLLHIPTHDVLINGIVYQPSGAGPHPIVVICHGLPRNEKFLDLAQAVRRAGLERFPGIAAIRKFIMPSEGCCSRASIHGSNR